jgi:glycosyltransferase involved in cell wall biosynthesis
VAQVLGSDVLDEQAISEIGGLRGKLYGRLPAFVCLAIEAARRSPNYDVVVTWGEPITVGVTALFALTRARTPHLALMFWLSKPTVRIPLRIFRTGLNRILTWSSFQREFAVTKLGFSDADVVLTKHPVDTAFYRPVVCEHSLIFSAGSTMRDFETLVEAVRGLNVQVLIAASVVRVLKRFRFRAAGVDVRDHLKRPANVRVKALGPIDVREALAKSLIVVVPLLESDIDAGVSVVLEGMAMGRPVIVSKTTGQIDVIEDGVNGYFVPVGDVAALRERIKSILADPEPAESLGMQARKYVETNHALEVFAEQLRLCVVDLAAQCEEAAVCD